MAACSTTVLVCFGLLLLCTPSCHGFMEQSLQSVKPEPLRLALRKAASRILLPMFGHGAQPSPAHNNNTDCVACTLILGILQTRCLSTGEDPKTVLDNFCHNAKDLVGKLLCEIMKDLLELFGVDKLNPQTSPETNCQGVKLCPSPLVCQLFKQWPPKGIVSISPRPSTADIPSGGGNELADVANLLELLTSKPGEKDNIHAVFDEHIPMVANDNDGDRHGTNLALRGGNWRGRDCNDKDNTVYPGRVQSVQAASVDHNCNGIVGTDSTGASYEAKFCGKSNQTGVVIIGDSAAAHFRIPPFILNGTEFFDDSRWDNVIHWGLNEADWPECSWATAYETQDNCPISYYEQGAITSIYTRMRERNLCNHRDYVNVAVNGARTSNVAPPTGDIMAFTRNQTHDAPALVFYALIGNDVCNGHPGFSHMTTPSEFYTNVVAAMKYLDTQLPMGSHVVFVPLADGLLLHEILHNRTHPIGVPYPDIYDYLICNGLAPCWGWMNSNATVRNMTQQRANELSAVYQTVMANNSFTHFDMVTAPAGAMKQAVQKWEAMGRDPAELIEPSDGFHPSTTAHMMISEYIWNWLEQEHPNFIGEVNSFNNEITEIFGNQGGY